MVELLQRLAEPSDRVLFALLAVVLGYVVLGAVVARRTRPHDEPTRSALRR